MADAYGNVLYAPSGSVKPYLNDLELLYSYARLFQKGCTVKQGQGVLQIGTPVELDSASGQYVVSTTSSTKTKGFLRQSVDTGLAYVAAPTGLAVTPQAGGATAGGQFVAGGTFFWVITYGNNYGETPASNEVTATVAANGSALLNGWTAPAGVTSINVYRGTVSGQEAVKVAVLGAAATSYTDTGLNGVPGKPPVTNSTAPLLQARVANIVMGGIVRKDLVEMANGGPLSSSQIVALGYARVDGDYGFIEF